MKKVRSFFLLLCLSLLLTGCEGRRFQDVAITSVKLASVTPQGFTGVSAVMELGIHNPTVPFEVTDLGGLVKFQGQDALEVSGEPLQVAGHSDEVYQVPLQGRIADGFNPLRLLRLLGGEAGMEDITFDIRARASLRSGLGKNIEMLDIPLSGLLGGLQDSQQQDEKIAE
mgnify:CR=1 FL=1